MTHLGVYDKGQTSPDYLPGDGLLVAHEVGLWNSSGSTLLAVAAVPPGTAAPLSPSGFRYVELDTTVTLIGGETYVIGASNPNPEGIIDEWARSATATFAADITYLEPRYDDSFQDDKLAVPLASGAGDTNGYFGPSFQYDLVPEPGSALLFGLGVIGIAGLRRRK